jgi:hypothetical protein
MTRGHRSPPIEDPMCLDRITSKLKTGIPGRDSQVNGTLF